MVHKALLTLPSFTGGMMPKTLGIVVVGLGRAGKVRVRDLNQKVLGEDAVLRGVISRRKVEEDVPSLSWDEALSREDVDAVVICTENDTHEKYARKCLEHGKHVLVEFPLSLSEESGKELLSLAERKGLICHVENIALLIQSHREIRESIKNKTVPLVDGRLHSVARFSCEWIGDLCRAGFPSFSGISKLEILVDLFGELTLQDAEFLHETDVHLLTCKFLTQSNRPVTWIEERVRDGKARETIGEFKYEDGTVLRPPPVGPRPPPTPGYKGLFAKDMEMFLAEISGERSSAEMAADKQRILCCLGLAENIEKMATAKKS